MALSELLALVQPPLTRPPGPKSDWMNAETLLGARFPADYKECIDVFGIGTFNDFLYLASPFSPNPYLNVSGRLRALHESERLMKLNFPEAPDSVVHPFSLHPESPGLIPWGFTDNGDDLFWHTLGEPDVWPVVVYSGRSGTYESHPMTMTLFLSSILSGRLQVSFFPEDFLMEPPAFSPR